MALGLVVLSVFCGPSTAPLSAEISRDQFTLALTFTTDYVYRGLSQNAEDPTLQASFDFEHPTGWFAGIWVSDTEIPAVPPAVHPRELEVDYYVGYRFRLSPSWSADLTGIQYTYPDSDSRKDYDYFETLGSLHYKDWLTLTVGHTEDLQGVGLPTATYEASFRAPLIRRIDLDLGYGYTDTERIFGFGYGYWSAGLSRSFTRWRFNLNFIDTDSTSERFFRDAAGDRVTAGATFYPF